MIKVSEHSCTGCGACKAACPVQAINMHENEYGFIYPEVDVVRCIECGKCEKVCHVLKENGDATLPLAYYALQLKNNDELNLVSSGGAFLALAKTIMSHGGIVYGAIQESNLQVTHIRIAEECELSRICRSKYLQSDISGCYERIKQDLKDKRVLFCGTGCQTNALVSYLGWKPANLILCEIVCHGVPSSLAFSKYCEELETKMSSSITSVVFRDKSAGWDHNNYCISFENGQKIFERSNYNPFHGAYLQGLLYRECCEACRYAKLERISDFVIADFWQYKGVLRENNMGVSLVAVYSHEGLSLMEECRDSAYIEVTSKEQALSSCRHLHCVPKANKYRKRYLESIKRIGYFKSFYRYAYIRIILGKLKQRLLRR